METLSSWHCSARGWLALSVSDRSYIFTGRSCGRGIADPVHGTRQVHPHSLRPLPGNRRMDQPAMGEQINRLYFIWAGI